MKKPSPFGLWTVVLVSLAFSRIFQNSAHAEWQQSDTDIGWRAGTNLLWQFSFDPKKGKPFFHPLTAGGTSLTSFKPEDHPWHYGLWFSWKYINHFNYWEEDRATGQAEGATHWSAPVIRTQADGSATIQLNLSYENPSNRVDMVENRELKISAPATDGSYRIDWTAQFTAGTAGAVLDRTPLPGEPRGQVNGGYAGLSLRMASAPLTMTIVCSTGLVTHFENERARPNAQAVGGNFYENTNAVGGIAIFSHPANIGENAPWYIVNSGQMRFLCSAILAPKPITLAPNATMSLDYRIVVQPKIWTTNELQSAYVEWMKAIKITH